MFDPTSFEPPRNVIAKLKLGLLKRHHRHWRRKHRTMIDVRNCLQVAVHHTCSNYGQWTAVRIRAICLVIEGNMEMLFADKDVHLEVFAWWNY